MAPVDSIFMSPDAAAAAEVMKGAASFVTSDNLAAVRFPCEHPSFWHGFSRQHPMKAVLMAEQVYQSPVETHSSAGMAL